MENDNKIAATHSNVAFSPYDAKQAGRRPPSPRTGRPHLADSAAIRRIMQLHAKGTLSLSAIAQKLVFEGIQTSRGDLHWGKATVMNTIRRETARQQKGNLQS